MHFSIFWNVFFKGPLVAKWGVSHSMIRVREKDGLPERKLCTGGVNNHQQP